MDNNSFSLNGIDMLADYGIKLQSVNEALIPKSRAKRITVPGRSGAYAIDNGDFDERTITLTCSRASAMDAVDLRELAYLLSKPVTLILPREPDKRYTGRMYDPQAIQRIGANFRRFSLPFSCFPFALGDEITEESADGRLEIDYAATAPAPCTITITNTGASTISSVVLTHIIDPEV